MLKSPFPYFVLIAALAFGAVDYFNQAQKAGSSFGAYPLSAYTADIKARFAETKGAMEAAREQSERQATLAKMHLPEAPDGWERREWEPGLSDRFSDDSQNEMQKEVTGAMDESAAMRALNSVMNNKQRRRAREEVWEYAGPEGTIRLLARYRPHAGRFLSEKITLDPNSAGIESKYGVPQEYGTIRGVTFYFAKRDLHDSSGTFPGAAPVHLIAPMGRDIKLAAFVESDPEMLLHLLERIDYDALNAMMDEPIANVGQAAQAPSDEERRVMLGKTYTAMAKRLERKRRRSDVENEAIAYAQAMAQSYATGEAVMLDPSVPSEADKVKAEVRQKIHQAKAEVKTKPAGKGVEYVYSKPLPKKKIEEFKQIAGTKKVVAQMGLNKSVKQFEEQNNLPKGSCAFSYEQYRVECALTAEQAAQRKAGNGTKKLAKNASSKGGDAPKRLKLSGGSSCLDGSKGALCK